MATPIELAQRVWQASQTWHLERVVRTPNGQRLRLVVSRNAYDHQSSVRAERWTEQAGWVYVTSIPITETPAHRISYVEPETARLLAALEETADAVLKQARRVLEG